jgi:hypothetical protein
MYDKKLEKKKQKVEQIHSEYEQLQEEVGLNLLFVIL